jgi:hypothetical protein
MVNSVTGTTMFDWWSLQMDVISGVDHWRLDPVGPLLMDSMQQHSGHRCCTTGLLGQRQPCENELIYRVDHMEYNYNMFT